MKDGFYIQSHEITPFTIAIMPKQDDYGSAGSYILEEEEKFEVKDKPSQVIDDACKFFGSSLKGRQIGTREISRMKSKLPISIDPSSGMYFFPTLSPNNPNCCWISHTHLKSINEVSNQETEIIFTKGQRIIVEVSHGSIANQVNRTAQYRYILDGRIQGLHMLK